MHRHGYKGRKLHRERDQREALIKGLADSLVQYESIETTLPKAKEIVSYVEKLISKAKKGDLHNRRQVISGMQTVKNANKLVDEIAPKLRGRDSGHLRIVRISLRRGDNAQLAKVSFVDDLNSAPVSKAVDDEKVSATNKPEAKPKSMAAKTKTTAKKAVKEAK